MRYDGERIDSRSNGAGVLLNSEMQRKTLQSIRNTLQGLALFGSPARARTRDPMINSHLLYQLSYRGRGRDNIEEAALLQGFSDTSERFFKVFHAGRVGNTNMSRHPKGRTWHECNTRMV